MHIYLYETLKGLSQVTPFVSIAQAKLATITYREEHPTVGFLEVVSFAQLLTEEERINYKPPTEFPAFAELW